MKVLVTGGEGFIGGHLLDALDDGIQFVGDVRKRDWFDKYPEADAVIHLAGVVPGAPGEYDDNVSGTERVLEYCRERNARIVFPSTNVYGRPENLPVTEDHPLNPENEYVASKLKAEESIRNSGVSHVIMRFANVYGPGQIGSFIVPTIVRQLSEIKKGKRSNVELSDLKRDYVYVGDVVDAFLKALNHDGDLTCNIGTGKATSARELVGMIQDIIGDFPVDYIESEGIPELCFSYSLAEEKLRWKPRTTLKEGLRLTLQSDS